MTALQPRQDTAGALLAGGAGRRLGGGDKPLRHLGGKPLLAHGLDRLQPQVPTILLNANGDPARFAEWGVPVVPDGVSGQPGPLAGILAALDWAAADPALRWVVTAPADSPFIPLDLVARLHAVREATGQPLACARSAGRVHPPIGLFPVALRDALRGALLAGERRVSRWTAAQGVAYADWTAEPCDPFFNVNTPEDLEQAERLLAAQKIPR